MGFWVMALGMIASIWCPLIMAAWRRDDGLGGARRVPLESAVVASDVCKGKSPAKGSFLAL